MTSLLTLMIIISLSSSLSLAQQPYIGASTTDCLNDHNSTSALGYFCNGLSATCRAFLTFRSSPPYDTVSSISALLGSNPADLASANSVSNAASFPAKKLVLVPISCSCNTNNNSNNGISRQKSHYQLDANYTIASGDTYYVVANGTFQGLSTCQAIQNQLGNPTARDLSVGHRIVVPLRCACPTKNQSDQGVRFLMSYVVAVGDSVSDIGDRFGVSVESIFEANDLSEGNSLIVDFTTLLIPLEKPPSSNQTVETPRVPFSPPPMANPANEDTKKKKKKTWIYALIGAILGLAFVLLVVFALVYFLVLRPKKRKSSKVDRKIIITSESFESVEKNSGEKYSRDLLEAIAETAQSIKVYKFEELKKSASGFGPESLIKGSVYRAVINGDPAAIKRVDGDISKEISLLQKINHFNVIRLSGVGFNGGYWYLVYEFASNGPLSDWLFNPKFGCLSWSQRIQIALDIATGLNYLHSFSNPSHVHKDIKSGNILLDSDFRAKIANFALARSSARSNEQEGQDGQFTVTKHVVGTVGYMAPEYLEHGLVSTKLDVYAFGVVLLEMLTGKEVSGLYEEKRELAEVFSGKGFGDFVDVGLGENYPGEIIGMVVKIVDRCLKKNVEARPTMDEIVQLLTITLSNSLSWESLAKDNI